MEQTKERSKWAGRLEVVLVMAAGEVFFIAAHYISIQPYYIWRFLLLAVLPLAVIPSHPFAYMGFTRKKIGKQLLFGLLTTLILYPVCLAAEYVFLQPLVPEGYRMTFRLITQGQSISWIAADAILIFFSSFPEELLFRGYFQNRLDFFTSSRYARWMIQAVLFGLIHIVNHLADPFSLESLFQISSTAVFGLVIVWLYYYKRDKGYTILSAMTTHVVYNFLLQLFIGTVGVPV